MSWNGSDKEKVKVEGQGQQRKDKFHSSTSTHNFNYKALLAGLIVVIGGGLAAWMMMRGENGETADSGGRGATRPTAIAEVKPAVVTNAPVVVEKPVEKKPELPPLKPGERRRVHWVRPANWDQMSPAEKTLCQPVARVIKPTGWDTRNRLFTEPSDKAFERLLSVRPGQMLIGTSNYGESFMKSFLKSLKTPIVINDDDSPEDKAMKQSVIDCRNDLKAAWDRGEDICEVMRKAEKEIKEQASYRCNLKQELWKLRNEGTASEDEYREFCAAADKMLEEKGLEPLKMGNFAYRKAQYDLQQESGDNETKESK